MTEEPRIRRIVIEDRGGELEIVENTCDGLLDSVGMLELTKIALVNGSIYDSLISDVNILSNVN